MDIESHSHVLSSGVCSIFIVQPTVNFGRYWIRTPNRFFLFSHQSCYVFPYAISKHFLCIYVRVD